jgi:hypothetical protein
MSKTLLPVALALLVNSALPATEKKERQPNPIAPSLNQLTDKEEKAIDRIINRFILVDTGKLRGEEGKKAVRDFQGLGPDAIPALIRGLNRAAKIDASCPALTIGRKLATLLRRSNDVELLEFARENIGAGVTRTKHGGVLRDLRTVCILRKRIAATNTALAGKRGKPVRTMKVAELSGEVKRARGVRLKLLLSELSRRRGEEATTALASAAASRDGLVSRLGRLYLTSRLTRLSSTAIKQKLKDKDAEIRTSAALVVGARKYPLAEELIGLLNDKSALVRKAAHKSLVKLARGKDFGPEQDASESERRLATEKWRMYWARQSDR